MGADVRMIATGTTDIEGKIFSVRFSAGYVVGNSSMYHPLAC